MNRMALIVVAGAALVLTACENKNPQPQARTEEPAKPLGQMDSTPPPADPYANEAMSPTPPMDRTTSGARPGSAAAKPAKSVREEPVARGGGQTYVVQKGDTLSGIAKKVYGDSSKWKKIWDANKSKVPNKDKLTVGTKLIIP